MRQRLAIEKLEARLNPGYTVVDTPSAVSFNNDGTTSVLALSVSGNQILYSINGGKAVALTQATTATLTKITVNGGAGNETIDLSGLGTNQKAMAAANGGATVDGKGGSDVITGTSYNDVLTGGDGADTINAGAGDDQLYSRDTSADSLNGGTGHDSAWFESLDTATNCEVWNPLATAANNRTQKVKVLVVNFDPLIPSQGNKHLYELFNGWGKPQELASGYEEALERASGGAVDFDLVEWRNLNEIPAFETGFRYTADQYYKNRVDDANWQTGTGATADMKRIFREQRIPELIDAGVADEVWFFGDHFMSIGGEAFMAGPGALNINGPVYADVPVSRPFACYGFSYARQVGEMLHNTGHRVENHGNRTWGNWSIPNAPVTIWDKFSANAAQFAGAAGIGTTHYPFNGTTDFDYGNTATINTWADDFLDYPEFTGATRPLSSSAWSKGATPDFQRDYLEWYFSHLPRGTGTNADGRQNNWWKYVYDFNDYTAAGQPLPMRASLQASDLYNLGGAEYRFKVAYSSANFINVASLDGADVRVTGPGGFDQLAKFVAASDAIDGPYRVATYKIAAPGGSWDAGERGQYTVTLQANQILDGAGGTLPVTALGGFQIRTVGGSALSNDADSLLTLRFDGTLTGVGGETPTTSKGVTYGAGMVGQAANFAANGLATYPLTNNIAAAAGTIEFWVKPEWAGSTTVQHAFFEAGNNFNNGLLIIKDSAPNIRVITWGDDPTTAAVEVNVERGVGVSTAAWKAGEWHHVAASWSGASQSLALYVDGVSVGSITNNVQLAAFSGSALTLGADVGGFAPALASMDEVRISNRVRTAAEILTDYQSGIASVKLSIDAATLNLDRFDAQRLVASAGGVDVSNQVIWTSSKTSVATVGSDGRVFGVGAGTVTITATLDSLTATSNVIITDTSRPTALLGKVADIVIESPADQLITVTYGDSTDLKVDTIDSRDIRVYSSNGASRYATFVSVAAGTTSRVATYKLAAPEGTWDARDNGTYAIEALGWQVSDSTNFFVAAQSLGSFKVAIPVIVAPGFVSGTVFQDLDADGKQSANEPAQGGVKVYVDANNNSKFDTGDTATITTAAGQYIFQIQQPGNFVIRQEVPAGFSQVSGPPVPLAVPPGQTVTANFGNRPTGGSVAGTVFYDANRNNVRDTGEPGQAGISVYLDLDGNSKFDTGEPTAVTANDGVFSVVAKVDGKFNLRIVSPAGQSPTGTAAQEFNLLNNAAFTGVAIGNGPTTTKSLPVYAAGADAGGGPQVNLYYPDGSLKSTFFAYGLNFRGGVRIATGDIDADGVDDIVTAAGPGGGPHVKVFSGANGALLRSFFAYPTTMSSGVFVATGDVDGDGRIDIVTGAGVGQSGYVEPRVRVFSGMTGSTTPIRDFIAYGYNVGVTVATGKIDADANADILTGPEQGNPHVKVISGANGAVLRSFFAYAPATGGQFYPVGVYVASGDVDGDGKDDIITGAGKGGGPHVRVFSNTSGAILREYFAYAGAFTGGVRVGVRDVNFDGRADVIVSPGTSSSTLTNKLKVFDPTGVSFRDIEPFAGFRGGVYVG